MYHITKISHENYPENLCVINSWINTWTQILLFIRNSPQVNLVINN